MQIRLPDVTLIYGEKQKLIYSSNVQETSTDVRVGLHLENGALIPSVAAETEPLCYVVLKWFFQDHERRNESVHIMGDAWERGYGDLEWRGIAPERCMPWYCLVSNGSDADACRSGRHTEGFGVKVRPSSFALWQYDAGGVTLSLDIRCGGRGVILNGRTLNPAEIIFRDYYDRSAYASGKAFCREMCTDPILPKQPVYGFNNWYYAYGVSSAEEIKRDARRLVACSKGLQTPYMVIDDGWQPNPCDGPWDRGNQNFPDMKLLAEQIEEIGAHPGIWIRPLVQQAKLDLPPSWRMEQDPRFLDPSRADVLAYVKENFARLVDWGYRLIKFDFVTYDLFVKWGMECPLFMADSGWSFYDRSKTSAEIILNLYRAIREASKDAVLIACNAIGHLCAGLVEINRTGDDTSGRDWKRTRKMGVNTLAFRSLHNGTFYAGDADCVGITKYVPWELNERWLYLLSQSGSPLFISWDPSEDSGRIHTSVCKALQINSIQKDELIPLDWMENNCPRVWSVNGETVEIDWFGRFAYHMFDN